MHGSLTNDLPEEAQRSIEVEIVAFDDTDVRKADLIDGSIGDRPDQCDWSIFLQ